jgi:hypothetical protein
MRQFILFLFLLISFSAPAQNNLVSYAGNSGKETFYDVLQITDGSFLVCGYADNLNWISNSVPKIQLANTGGINNGQGTNRYGIILQLSEDMQQIMRVVYFPQGVVEDVRFIKTNSIPYQPTGDLFISCNTADTDPNNGGYIIAKLDKNFVNGIPSALLWKQTVWAKSGPKDYHPWDVTSKGEIYYISGEAHGYDWSAVYCLNQNGSRKIVNNWRTHWLDNGSEWRGTPASSYPGGIDSVAYSGIALKIWGRCELRSWTQADYDNYHTDGNGGYKKGKWPIDVLFNGPCDPGNPSANGPGYTGYSPESCCPVLGGSSICVDRTNNNLYIGMNMKSNAQNSPDFEPAVIAMDSTGNMRWWSRLYHEITPAGDTMISLPDQYVDALAIDYTNGKLVVAARAHGNNTENLWEGNTVNIDPNAYGFQNRFTGSNGNIHESWLGKLRLSDGVLTNSTYVAELAEGTGGLGTPHADPNLDGWPDPNTGWPDVNTTRLARNNMKVSSEGNVCILGVGRRTITTANAYQKMVKPFYGGLSCWNSFVRVYDDDFHVPLYSSLIVGQWDTVTQAGGDNTEIFGVYKAADGVVCVGRQKANNGVPVGNNIPVANVPSWGSPTPQNETAILVYYRASNLADSDDDITRIAGNHTRAINKPELYPNPTSGEVYLHHYAETKESCTIEIFDLLGRKMFTEVVTAERGPNRFAISLSKLARGSYIVRLHSNAADSYSRVVLQ